MNDDNSVDEILLYAIRSEQETAYFYLRLSHKARNAKVKRIFEQYAREVFAHIVRLTRVRENGPTENVLNKLSGFKLSDYVIDLSPASNLTYSEELVLAMRKIRATFKLYFDLASKANDQDTHALLVTLAQEETKHKLGFEVEYNESLLVC